MKTANAKKLALSLVVGGWAFSSVAQTPLSNLVFTVGTTTRDAASNNWSYVVVGAAPPSFLAGKRFLVYGKPGYPTNAGTFTVRGTLLEQTDAASISALLNQSVSLGQDLSSLSNALNTLLHNLAGITNQTLPQKILTAFQMGRSDPSTVASLALLANANPGLRLCAGHGFAEPMAAITTYEVREVNPASGAAGDVVGRVNLVPGAPVVLPAPGAPFQVKTNRPSDHLLIRLRWGTPPALSRLSLLQFGYNVWRISASNAIAGNFQITPPTPDQLHTNPNFTRANPAAAAFANKLFSTGTGTGAADDPADRTTYFFADNGRATLHTNFNAGDQLYYFITARDLLGRDGLASPGGLATACRRIPPATPEDARVENTVIPGTTNQGRLRVVWTQDTNATDAVSQYWVYRWANPTDALTNDFAPSSNRLAIVSQLAGTNVNSFLDDTAGARTNANPTNLWYTVRAVSSGGCDPLLSAQSSPAWGVLRERTAPDATSGSVVGSCGTPVVMFQNFATNSVAPDTFWHVLLTCQRRDPGIAWVTLVLSNEFVGLQTNGPIYFSPVSDVAQTEFTIPAPYQTSSPIWASCTVGTLYDQVAQPAAVSFNGPITFGQQKEVVFLAGQLLATALASSDPLLNALNNGNSVCYPANNVTPDASGMVSMRFNVAPGLPLFVQALTNNTWNDIAVVTPDTNGVYWVLYPACLVGPLPTFRGCAVNLPADAGCDQHVARAADTGPVAPLRVRFRLTPRAREFRVYRRADDGPLTLFAQGAASYDPINTSKILEARDEAMPVVPSRLCYFVQLLDENGNGSPLAFIGCKEVKPDKPPRPVLAEPKPAGTVASPQVLLNWFCPTAGISRFELKIKRLDPPSPGLPSGIISLQLKAFTGFNPKASYLGLSQLLNTSVKKLAAILFDEGQLTSPVGGGLGPGPQFTLTAGVLPNVNYLVSVTPVDDQGKILESASSEAWPFIWTAPFQPASVPWPARPLPPVTDFDDNLNVADYEPFYPRVRAVLLTDLYFQTDPRYPVGVCIGYLEPFPNGSYQSNVRVDAYATYNVPINNLGPTWGFDPNDYLFHRSSGDPSRRGDPLLPIVVYRQQVANTNFPQVSGDITQVSPMLERLPWTSAICTDCSPHRGYVTILDKLIAIAWKFDQQTYHQHVMFCLRDQQPVLLGAKYRYFVVRFNAKREVQETIQAGEVELPLN